MDAFCVDCNGDIYTVVDDEGDVVLLSDLVQFPGPVNEVGGAEVLFSELHQGDTVLDGFFHLLVDGKPGWDHFVVGDEIEGVVCGCLVEHGGEMGLQPEEDVDRTTNIHIALQLSI